MKPYERDVEDVLLEHEKEIRSQLKETYTAALADVKKQLKSLLKDPENQTKIMQAKYQKQLEADLQRILAGLGDSTVEGVEDYLQKSYEDGFLGCLYEMHRQDVCLVLQVPEDQVERVIRRDTAGYNFSERLYRDKEQLVQDVKSELSRGLATGAGYKQIARQLAAVSEASLYRSYRIVRTEGHRVQNESRMDSMNAAKAKGANVVKQWDATVDGRTRPSHRKLDGQIRELDEPFEVDGKKAMYPGGFGIAKEDIWCRCRMVQRARWALSEEEQKYSRIAGDIISTKSDTYRQWKAEYLEKTSGYGKKTRIEWTQEKKREAIRAYEQFESDLDELGNSQLKKLLKTMSDEATIGFSQYNYCGYTDETDIITLQPTASSADIAHEMMHRFDRYGRISSTEEFIEAFQEDYADLYYAAHDTGRNIKTMLQSDYRHMFQDNTPKQGYHSVCDIISAMSKGTVKLRYGHSRDYWVSEEIQCSEAFADLGTILFEENPEVLKTAAELFPRLERYVRSIVEGY